MVTYKSRLSLSDLLLQADVVEQLRERFSHIQNSLTTTIHEASGLTSLSEAQLRYAETRGLLAPSRAASDADAESPTRGQRRYTVENLLRAHLIAFILERGYSLSEISTFMENNVSVIHELLETTSLRLQPVLDAANAVLFKRFFVPRALYSALSLIFERDAIADAGIIVPVRASIGELQLIAPGEVETADDLIHLGHILVAWRARGRPLATFITAGNPFERDQQVRLTPFSLSGRASRERLFDPLGLGGPFSSFSPPVQAYIVYSPQSEPEMIQADHQLALRHENNRRSGHGARRLPNPRAVAARLISYVQSMSCGDVAAIGQTETSLSDALFFNAPEMVNSALGDALLNRLADTTVELGGSKLPRPLGAPAYASVVEALEAARLAEHAEAAAATETALRWRFACVLTPREPDTALKRQELVVRAQSKLGPHRIGVTTTSPQLNGGLTFRAYSSGRVAYRPIVDPRDPAVSYWSEESPIGSAIAAPTMDGQGTEHSQPPAVIYIASAEPNAFDEDDFLLIRVMGRLVAEIVQTYNSRGQLPNALTDTLADPEIVDGFFAEFLSELSFMTDLQTTLSGLHSVEPAQASQTSLTSLTSLTLIGLDVNDYSAIQWRQGDRVARMLIREIGNRLKQRMTDGLTRGVSTTRLYRAWGDRFYLLVRNEECAMARRRAERIRQDISIEYRLEDGSLPVIRASGGSDASQAPGGIPVGVRMAGMTLSKDELGAQLQRAGGNVISCAASLVRLLEDGLLRAHEASNKDACSVWWNGELNDYEPTVPPAGER
jgi:DNA-binding transcriptional MerR regulator/GGDEF domain-containing protein